MPVREKGTNGAGSRTARPFSRPVHVQSARNRGPLRRQRWNSPQRQKEINLGVKAATHCGEISVLEEAGFELVWGFSCQAVVLGCADSFLFGAGKAVFRPVACDQVRGARGRGQGTETVAKLGGLPPSGRLCFAAP